MTTRSWISAIVLLGLVFGLIPPDVTSHASPAVVLQSLILRPESIKTQTGSSVGEVESLHTQDQWQSIDTPAKYVLFETPDVIYDGFRTYKFPDPGRLSTFKSLVVQVNFKGPAKATQAWTWYLFDWKAKKWVIAGDNASVTADVWTQLRLGATLINPVRFVNPTTLEIRLNLVSDNATQDAKLDYEAIKIAYDLMPVRGLAYSPYRDCQTPGGNLGPTLANIKQDLQIIASMSNAVRTYSSTGINALIPVEAYKLGLRVSAGAWLGKDKDANEAEITSLIQIANLKVDGKYIVESAIVGNEVLLRKDLTEAELIGYIKRVKQAVHIPVTTAEVGEVLMIHPLVMNVVDFEMVHLYPFWVGKSIVGAAQDAVKIYHSIQLRSKGKRVVIGETGWPSSGPAKGLAVPSPANQYRYAREFFTLAAKENVEFFYFEAFDEMWKARERGVGQFWGLFRANRTAKHNLPSVMIPSAAGIQTYSNVSLVPQPDPSAFYVYYDIFHPVNNFSPSGWMGDITKIHMNSCVRVGTWPGTAMRVSYTPVSLDSEGWGGVYWLNPDGNWGTVPPGPDPTAPPVGFNLTKYRQVAFRARADVGGTQIKFFVGGVSKDSLGNPLPYPSSIPEPIYAQESDPVDGFVNLTTAWKEYHIDLTKADLSYVIDGFGWAAERARTPGNKIFYLDDIRFIKTAPGSVPVVPIHIYSGELLRTGLGMGIDTSGNLRDWVDDLHGSMKASYPAGQAWGAVFITVGKPALPGQRLSMDLSKHHFLSVAMRGEQGGETVSIGIKDKNQPDNGLESKKAVSLTNSWKTYTFDLQSFIGADRTQLYIPIEFVFAGTTAKTIYFRNVQYLP